MTDTRGNTIMSEHEHDCEECSEDYGPCEDHCEVVIVREGASSRTADDLAATFVEDVATMYEDEHGRPPEGEHYVTASDYRAAIHNENERADRENVGRPWNEREYVSGWSPENGTLTRDDGTIVTWSDGEMGQWLSDAIVSAEGDLSDLGWSVSWDDGYRIYRTTGGPFFDYEGACVVRDTSLGGSVICAICAPDGTCECVVCVPEGEQDEHPCETCRESVREGGSADA
jgi:hypothetical protein